MTTEKNLFLWVLFVCLVCLAGMFLVSMISAERGKCKESLLEQTLKIAELEERIFWLRRVNKSSMALEQLLTPLAIRELEALNEVIAQGEDGLRSASP